MHVTIKTKERTALKRMCKAKITKVLSMVIIKMVITMMKKNKMKIGKTAAAKPCSKMADTFI